MILPLAERAYGFFAGAYHRHWDKRGGWRAPVPVISVGNITVGGNGKTPFVIALVKLLEKHFPHLQERNRIAVLSRGYGRKSKELTIVEIDSHWEESGDEPLLIKRSCPKALVISNASRVESAKVAANEFGAMLIILDDGFQHRALARDIDIVLLDSQAPLENGRLLPAGRLRERPSGLARASVFVAVGTGSAVEPLSRAFDKPLYHLTAAPLAQEWLQTRSVPAFLLTGVARPDRVRGSLEKSDFVIKGHRAFRDHHAFSNNDLNEVLRAAHAAKAEVVLTTGKDKARILSWNGHIPLIEIPYSVILTEEEKFVDWIHKYVVI